MGKVLHNLEVPTHICHGCCRKWNPSVKGKGNLKIQSIIPNQLSFHQSRTWLHIKLEKCACCIFTLCTAEVVETEGWTYSKMGSQHSTTRSIAFFLRKQQNPEQYKVFTSEILNLNIKKEILREISKTNIHTMLREILQRKTKLHMSSPITACSISDAGWNSNIEVFGPWI